LAERRKKVCNNFEKKISDRREKRKVDFFCRPFVIENGNKEPLIETLSEGVERELVPLLRKSSSQPGNGEFRDLTFLPKEGVMRSGKHSL